MNLLSQHDIGLAEPYWCQSLWVVCPVQPTSRKKSKRPIIEVKAQENSNKSATSRKKQKPSDKVVLPTVPAASNMPTRDVVTTDVIKKLEDKLHTKYESDLASYQQEKSKLEAKFALANL